MSSYTGLSPKNPNRYTGANLFLTTVVTRTRAPTGADYRQPENGKLYPTGSLWLVGKDPTTGTEGDLWYLSKIVANVGYWVMLSTGVVGPIENFVVQDSTAPGVIPVLPTAGGTITINGAAVANHNIPVETHTRALNEYNLEVQYASSAASTDATLNGLSHYNSTQFSVDADGFVSLAGGGGALDSIGVDATSGTGTNPVLPTALGLVTVNGALVAADSNPVRTVSTAPNTYQIQIQKSQALASPDSTKVGMANFNSTQFNVDADGFVSAINDGASVGVVNLGITYSGGTFTVRGAQASLSASNIAYVTLQSKTPGNVVTIPVTANQTFIDDAGASTIVGNLFGLITGVAASNNLPFFLYAVLNDAENAISFMISRYPNTKVSPVAAKIGKTGSAVADSQGSFFALGNPTVADYESNPCICIGSFRMTMSAADDWTVSALTISDGIGNFQENIEFTFNPGQFGAASGKYFFDNGGTAPSFNTSSYSYFVGMDNFYTVTAGFEDCSVAGVGAVTLLLANSYYMSAHAVGSTQIKDATSNIFVGTSSILTGTENAVRIWIAGAASALAVTNDYVTVSANYDIFYSYRGFIAFS